VNTEEMINDVENIVLDPSYTRDDILKLLNRAKLACASKAFLPGLSGGTGSVTTVSDGNLVALPTNFHRELFAASIDGEPIKIYDNKALMLAKMGHVMNEVGDVSACCVSGRYLFYMDTPVTPVTINLSYYEKPTPMTDSSSSYADDMTSENELYDSTLIAFACWHLFSRIEQGLEGQKTDTAYYKDRFEKGCLEIESSYAQGRPRRPPIICKVNW